MDENRIRIVWFEEFIENKLEIFHDICRFLDIDDEVVIQANESHQNSREQVLNRIDRMFCEDRPSINTSWDPQVRSWVLSQIRNDNSRLLDYFGKPADYWDNLSE